MKNGVPGKSKRTKESATEETVQASSGNVFADLGLPNPEDCLAKAELVRRIAAVIAARKLAQGRAAAILDIDSLQLSALLRGRFDDFSTEQLFRFLNALGQDVEIVIRPHPSRRGRASTRVVRT